MLYTFLPSCWLSNSLMLVRCFQKRKPKAWWNVVAIYKSLLNDYHAIPSRFWSFCVSTLLTYLFFSFAPSRMILWYQNSTHVKLAEPTWQSVSDDLSQRGIQSLNLTVRPRKSMVARWSSLLVFRGTNLSGFGRRRRHHMELVDLGKTRCRWKFHHDCNTTHFSAE